MKVGYVYIMASRRNGTLYIGATRDLAKRAWEHRNGFVPGFTREYGCKLLVWYEAYDDLQQARLREQQMKKWPVEAQHDRADESGMARPLSHPGLGCA